MRVIMTLSTNVAPTVLINQSDMYTNCRLAESMILFHILKKKFKSLIRNTERKNNLKKQTDFR